MPYEENWVDPELFMLGETADGKPVPVYHTYKNDAINDATRTYSYTLNRWAREADTAVTGEDGVFDIRELPGYDQHFAAKNVFDAGEIKAFIQQKITEGYFNSWTWEGDDGPSSIGDDPGPDEPTQEYARVVWRPEDVQSIVENLPTGDADEFLQRNAKQIQSDMTERGWESIKTLLSLDGYDEGDDE